MEADEAVQKAADAMRRAEQQDASKVKDISEDLKKKIKERAAGATVTKTL